MLDDLLKIHRDESGGPVVEYILISALVIIPFGMATPVALDMIRTYFYRCAEIVAMPFP